MIDILCRYDARDQAPVVFLRDTIQGDKIQVWTGKGQPQVMPLDYYKMTSPLSAEDERVLMERYKQATGKQDQQIRITHRLPRASRPLPNVLTGSTAAPAGQPMKDLNPPPAPAQQRKASSTGAKPLDAQPMPQGDLPQAGETPAPMPAAATTVAPVDPNEPPSASLFRRIQELNKRSADLHQNILNLQAEQEKATTEYDTSKQAIKELAVELEQALEAEAAEEQRRRKEMLAALTGAVAIDTLAETLQQAGAAPSSTAPATPPAPSKAQSNNKGTATKPPAKTASKPAAKTTTTRKK